MKTFRTTLYFKSSMGGMMKIAYLDFMTQDNITPDQLQELTAKYEAKLVADCLDINTAEVSQEAEKPQEENDEQSDE